MIDSLISFPKIFEDSSLKLCSRYRDQNSINHFQSGTLCSSLIGFLSVINVNDWDPRFKYPEYEFYVNAANTDVGHIVGVVEVFDGDVGDLVSLDLIGHSARYEQVVLV